MPTEPDLRTPRDRVRAFFSRDLIADLDELAPVVTAALAEDRTEDDITTRLLVSDDWEGSATVLAKEAGVVSGLAVAAHVFQLVDPEVTVTTTLAEGQLVAPGSTVLTISGAYDSILRGERTALNFLRRMSGIATATHEMVRSLGSETTRLLDTRKTAPGLRMLDKLAVRAGGGWSHRTHLAELALVKENHIAAAGGLAVVLDALRPALDRHDLVEIEVGSLDDAQLCARAGVPLLLLDNMGHTAMTTTVRALEDEFGDGRPATEASGNITRESAAVAASTGVDYISSGALTHSSRDLDLSLLSRRRE